jgi:hypothetical protein
MKKNLSKMLVSSILVGALTFIPVSGGIKSANAGTEITNNKYYDNLKKERMQRYGEYLEKLIFEGETQFLVIERHFLKKGKDPKEYFKQIERDTGNAIFKGNELRVISVYPRPVGFAERSYSDLEHEIITKELLKYLEEAKQKGYKALSRFDFNLNQIKNVRQFEIDELIEMFRKSRK